MGMLFRYDVMKRSNVEEYSIFIDSCPDDIVIVRKREESP